MKRIYLIIIGLLFICRLSAQIDLNTNFDILSNQPIDSRSVIDNLSDTTSVTWVYEGLSAYVKGLDKFYVYNGSFWEKEVSVDNITNISLMGSRAYFKQKIEAGARVDIAIFGDSKTNTRNRGTQQFSDSIRKKFGNGGQGYYNFGTSAPWGLWYTLGSSTSTSSTDTQAMGNHSINFTDATANATFTIYSQTASVEDSLTYFTEFDLYYLGQTGGGTFTVKVDGNLKRTINTSLTTGKDSIQINGLSNGAHTILIECTSLGTGVKLYEGNFKRGSSGVIVHAIARGGYTAADMRNRLFQSENQTVLADLGIETVMMRYGANETAGSTNIDTMKTAMIAIADRVRATDEKADIIIIGVEGLGSPYDSKPYNLGQKQLAIDSLYGFIDLRAINSNWERWRNLGYTDTPTDDVHSNELGGNIIGAFLYNNFEGDYNNEIGLTPNGLSGTTNELAYFDTQSSVSSFPYSWSGSGLNYGGTPTNGQRFSIFDNGKALVTLGSNEWFNINNIAGNIDFTWWSVYDGSDYRYTTSATAAKWTASTTIPFRIQYETGTDGNIVNFSDGIFLTNQGQLGLPTYDLTSSPSFANEAVDYYLGTNSLGNVIPLDLATVKTNLGLTKTANSMAYFNNSGALVTNAVTNSIIGGLGSYSGGKWWAYFANQSGYVEINHFAELVSSNTWMGVGGVRASRWYRDSGRSFAVSSSNGTIAGDTITWNVDFEIIGSNGEIKLNRYTSGTAISGTTNHFISQESDGTLIPRTAAQFKTDLGIEEEHGNASGTTTASGDLVISHSLGTASLTVNAIFEGTGNIGFCQVVAKSTSTVDIRCYDYTGTALTTTSVSLDYIIKKQ